MLPISNKVSIPASEIEIRAIRAGGPGGQHVNKVSSAVHLRFDIRASSLPDYYKSRLLRLKDGRITRDGVVVIKSGQHRSRRQNTESALDRLAELVRSVKTSPRRRIPTQPTRASRQRRLDQKARRGQLKRSRRKDIRDDA